jgi:predicted deacetylase
MQALLTLHDVMPHTLPRVRDLIERLPAAALPRLALLVVPGLPWDRDQLVQLRQWQRKGLMLAGHGWEHRCRRITTTYHQLHSRFVSRQAAEHLSLTRDELMDLVRDCHQWFGKQGLGEPDYYVPPAWAIGALTRDDLRHLPFRYYEDTGGIYDSLTGRYARLPLAGFEADKPWRRHSLRLWNALNSRLSSAQRPLRLSIHPYDAELLLANDMWRMLEQVTIWRDYRALGTAHLREPNKVGV